MRTRVQVTPQATQFVKSLAPEPRRTLTLAIRALTQDKGDLKRLEGKLEGYTRLRVAGHRVIFREDFRSGERVIDCVFAEKRAIVYELFIKLRTEEIAEATP